VDEELHGRGVWQEAQTRVHGIPRIQAHACGPPQESQHGLYPGMVQHERRVYELLHLEQLHAGQGACHDGRVVEVVRG